MKEWKKVEIFDTTLRDGQQSPWAAMSTEDNIAYVLMAADMWVDVMEVGFPSASVEEFERVKKISDVLMTWEKSPMIAWLCQLRESQVKKTIEALDVAIKNWKWRVHTYFPIDPELMKASVGDMDPKQIEEDVYRLCKMASDAGAQVQFSLEWYSMIWDNFEFGTSLLDAAVRWWATVLNCPDTIGGSSWMQGEDYFIHKINAHSDILFDRFHNIDLKFSTHNHNDMGTAVENSIKAASKTPVSQVECTVNGIGERAGNASMQEVVMQIYMYGKNVWLFTEIDTTKLQAISDFVAKKMLPRQPNSPITWDNAARHTAGWHTNALLENPTVYQPYDPVVVGKKWIELVFGPSSGGNHAKHIVESFGYVCKDAEKTQIAQFIKNMYKDRYKWVTNEEVIDGYFEYRYEHNTKPVEINKINFNRQNGNTSVELLWKFFDKDSVSKDIIWEDWAFTAVKQLFDEMIPWYIVEDYGQTADSPTTSANAISYTIINKDGKKFKWYGKSRDIEKSAIRALIDAYNKAWIESRFRM